MEDLAMPSDIAPRAETTTHVIRLARFAVLCTLGLSVVLLLADFLGRGWSSNDLRFLTEKVVITFVYGIAAEIVVAIAAVTCLALWKA
jgi:hypothetical protein